MHIKVLHGTIDANEVVMLLFIFKCTVCGSCWVVPLERGTEHDREVYLKYSRGEYGLEFYIFLTGTLALFSTSFKPLKLLPYWDDYC